MLRKLRCLLLLIYYYKWHLWSKVRCDQDELNISHEITPWPDDQNCCPHSFYSSLLFTGCMWELLTNFIGETSEKTWWNIQYLITHYWAKPFNPCHETQVPFAHNLSSYSRLFRIQDHWIPHLLCRNSAVIMTPPSAKAINLITCNTPRELDCS